MTEEYPKIEDGCVISSWKCQNPSRDEMESDPEQKKRCKECPVCHMILCQFHMSDPRHMKDCNFRSNQERVLLEEQRAEQHKKDEAERLKKRDEAIKKQKFEEKEKIRRENIANRNKEYMNKG